MESVDGNWSEAVEDLIDSGDTEKAISLLESVISKLETNPTDLKLASALTDLAKIYSSKGFSLKSDELHSRASLIKHVLPSRVLDVNKNNFEEDQPSPSVDATSDLRVEDDDWESIADNAAILLPSAQCLPSVSKLSLEEAKVEGPKRRGRGTFSYKKDKSCCDQTSDESSRDQTSDKSSVINSSEDRPTSDDYRESTELQYSTRCGTRHVLVLSDFSPSTRTSQLEKLFEDFKNQGFVIQWVNDTVALAVFRTPSIALEASKCIECSFTVRILEEDDIIMSLISRRVLEPPRPRPPTSVRTANRLIAHGMGIKLPATTFGSKELRKQEEARKNRIVERQNMRDDAWGE